MPAPPRSNQIRFSVDPRDISPEKAARRLHLTLTQFERVLPRLLARGFPPPDPDTGNFDLKVIDLWMDGRVTVTAAASPRGAREMAGFRRSLLDDQQGSVVDQPRPLDARAIGDPRSVAERLAHLKTRKKPNNP